MSNTPNLNRHNFAIKKAIGEIWGSYEISQIDLSANYQIPKLFLMENLHQKFISKIQSYI